MGLFDDFEEEVKKPEQPAKKVEEVKREDYGMRIFVMGGSDRMIKPMEEDEIEVNLKNTGLKEDDIEISFRSRVETLGEQALSEWIAAPKNTDKLDFSRDENGIYKAHIHLNPGESESFNISVRAQGDLKYGEKCVILISTTSRQDPLKSEIETITIVAVQTILAVKTQLGYEKNVADSIEARSKKGHLGVLSVLCPVTLRGYIFVEAMNPERLYDVIRSIRRARGMVKGELKLADIEHYLAPKIAVSGMVEGDIVELVSGPFKGEKARIKQVDETKETVTVELFEAMVPIPVTVRGEDVRVIQKDEKEES
jgi:transcriptional antiterminator NusG